MSDIPEFVYKQYGDRRRDFKTGKRREFREVQKALSEFKHGCACCPEYDTKIKQLFAVANEIEDALSVKRWGR